MNGNFSPWGSNRNDDRWAHDWNKDKNNLDQKSETWVQLDPDFREFFKTTGILEHARGGKKIWFIGSGNGKELDVLLTIAPGADIIEIEQGPDLCDAAKRFLNAGSLTNNQAKADSIVIEADFVNGAGLREIVERRQNGVFPDIIVCISCMHLYTTTYQATAAGMWTGLLVLAEGSCVIFTTRDQNTKILHAMLAFRNG